MGSEGMELVGNMSQIEDWETCEAYIWEKAARVVCHPRFDYFIVFFIFLNAVVIGAETDYSSRSPAAPLPHIFRVCDVFFCILFTVELALKFFVYRRDFFVKADWAWNIYDTLLIVLQLSEECVVAIVGPRGITGAINDGRSGGLNLSFMRVLRLLRFVRIVRLFRVLRVIGE